MLQKKAAEKNWHVDNVSDLARVIRLVDTNNLKDTNDIRTAKFEELDYEGQYYTMESLRHAIPVQEMHGKKQKGKAKTLSGENYPPSYFESIKNKCKFIEHCVEHADDLPEPYWYALLTIAARCVRGPEICHQISKADTRYDATETQDKINHAIADTGPMSCKYIESNITSDCCKSCTFRDMVLSPILLGKEFDFIDEVNNTIAVINVSGKVCVMEEITDPENGRPDIKLMSIYDFYNWYANKTIRTNSGQKEISRLWFTSVRRRDYNGIIFDPRGGKPGYYNLWRGFAIDSVQGDCSLYLTHIYKIIAGGNKEFYGWILAWMARIIQDPGGKRPGTSIVLLGKQGAGKGAFVEHFARIIGSHYLQLTSQSQIVGRFNSHLKNVLLLYCDEVADADDK